MAYCTEADYTERYGAEELLQLTDRENTGEVDSAVFNAANDDATALIDTYLSARYALPFASVPRTLTATACKLVRYGLYADQVTEKVVKDYDDAVKLIAAIGRGDVAIGIDAVGSQPAPSSGEAIMASGGRIFGREDDGFI